MAPAPRADGTGARGFRDSIETYVDLDDVAQAEYEALLAEEGNEEVATMEMTWAGRIAHEARQSALQEGRAEGREEGREEGQRELLLRQLERRFGPLSPATRKRVSDLTSIEELSGLAERLLAATRLEELGL